MTESKTIEVGDMGAWATARQWANAIEDEFKVECSVRSKYQLKEMGYGGVAAIIFEGILMGGDSPIAQLADASLWRPLGSPRYWLEAHSSGVVLVWEK